jgi:hypothetical protein
MWQHVYSGVLPPGHVHAKTDLKAIKDAFNTHGFAIVQFLTKEQCNEHILMIWKNILLNQPWSDKYKIEIKGKDGTVLDAWNPAHVPEFLEIVTGYLDNDMLKMLTEGSPMHRQFGACCDPAAWHDQEIWNLRQDPEFCRIIDRIYGHQNWRTHAERKIHMLPCQGEGISAHFDQATSKVLARAEARDDSIGVLQIKFAFSDAKIKVAPGTHSHDFWLEFKKHYKDIMTLTSKKPKNGLDKNDADPMGIRKMIETFLIPFGAFAVFQNMWHEHPKHGRNSKIVFGAYMGTTTDMSEVDNAIDSFIHGKPQKKFPSGDDVHYVPLKYFNFPRHMRKKIDMLPLHEGPLWPGQERCELHPMVRRKETGQKLLYMVPPENVGYVPPTLTALGLKNLVGFERREKMRQSGEWDGSDTWTWRAGASAAAVAPLPAVAVSAGPAEKPMSGSEGKERADDADAGAAAAGSKRKAEIEYIEISDDDEY